MSLHILQISDTHLGADPSFEIAPANHPWLRSHAVVQAVHRWISVEQIPVDCIVHTGDIVHRGHIHSPTCTLRDGIVYASCGSSAVHLPNWPTADAGIPSSEPVAFVQYIQITQTGVSLKPHWVFLSPSEARS